MRGSHWSFVYTFAFEIWYDYYNTLSSTAKSQIKKAALYSSGINLGQISPLRAYQEENPSSAINLPINLDERIVTLISPSDFGYAGGNICTDITNVSCGSENWLRKNMSYWTEFDCHVQMDYTYGTCYVENGTAINIDGSYGRNTERGVLPVVFLNPNVKLTGTGENTPEGIYKIS